MRHTGSPRYGPAYFSRVVVSLLPSSFPRAHSPPLTQYTVTCRHPSPLAPFTPYILPVWAAFSCPGCPVQVHSLILYSECCLGLERSAIRGSSEIPISQYSGQALPLPFPPLSTLSSPESSLLLFSSSLVPLPSRIAPITAQIGGAGKEANPIHLHFCSAWQILSTEQMLNEQWPEYRQMVSCGIV